MATGKSAAADVELAKQAHLESMALADKAKADVDAARANQGVEEAKLARAKTLLAYADIKAPFAGVITRRHVDPGHYVSPSGTAGQPLVVVERDDVLRVIVDIPEAEVALVNIGDSVTLVAPRFEDRN